MWTNSETGKYMSNIVKMHYSTNRIKPNTKADPESRPGVCFGSASSSLFKKLRPLWVC